MKKLYPFQHLVPYHESTLHRHNFATLYENILNTSSKELHQHDVEFALCGDGMDFWHSNNVKWSVEILVHFGLEE